MTALSLRGISVRLTRGVRPRQRTASIGEMGERSRLPVDAVHAKAQLSPQRGESLFWSQSGMNMSLEFPDPKYYVPNAVRVWWELL